MAIFLKLGDDIKGESRDDKHKDWSEIESFDWNVSTPSAGVSTGGRAKVEANFSNVNVSKRVDAASSDSFYHCATGTVIPLVEIEVCEATKDKIAYLRYELKNCLITSDSVGASYGDQEGPYETLSLSYEEIKQIYKSLDDEGKEKAEHEKEFSLVARQK